MTLTDDQVLEILDWVQEGVPTLTIGSSRFVLVDVLVLELHRKGRGGRWTWAPHTGTHRWTNLPYWFLQEVKTWVDRGMRLDLVAHGRAMGARTL